MWLRIVSFFALLLFAACGNQPAPPSAPLFETVRSLQPRAKGSVFIFTINPNDCFRCINVLYTRMNHVAADTTGAHSIVIILRNRREVERREIFAHVLNEIDTTKVPVLWNDSLYDAVEKEFGGPPGQSLLLLYDPSGRKQFCRPVKSLTGAEPELKHIFD